MSPRTGRPPKENARKISLNIRISEKEAELIQSCADDMKKTRTDVIIKGVEMVRSELDKKK